MKYGSGELVVKELERQFKIWKTIKLGTGLKTADDFRKALKDNGFNISDRADDILGNPVFKTITEETEVDLVLVTTAELGFKKGVTHEDIYKRVKAFGLELCPSEVGPQLRLQYQDQPNGEWVLVGMEPVTDSHGNLCVFCVMCDDSELWLNGAWNNTAYVWNSDSQWIFHLPRK